MPLAVAGPVEFDDHHIEAAQVDEHLQRALTVLGLLDLVALGEQPAHPQANDRVVVDDQAASLLAQPPHAPRPGRPGPRTARPPAGLRPRLRGATAKPLRVLAVVPPP